MLSSVGNYRDIIFNSLLVGVLLCTGSAWFLLGYKLDSYLKITFLDIGQGDSYLITTPDKINLLVDGGRDLSPVSELQRVLALGQGVDIVMISHPDADHTTALPEIATKYAVKEAIFNMQTVDNDSFNQFVEVLVTKGLGRHPAIAGDVWRVGCCVKIEIIWPIISPSNSIETNPNSIGYKLTYGNFSMLSMGDLDSDQELQAIRNKEIDVDLLKVSHHGSKNSTPQELLNAIRPEVAVIQVGKNSYGHPYPGVINNLNKSGARVLSNLANGQVQIYSDGNSYNILTEK